MQSAGSRGGIGLRLALMASLVAPTAGAQSEIAISMDGPPAAPRVNSPGAIGVYSGTPIVHTLAAIGQAPLSYAVTGLPAGVSVDAATGRISGSAAAGEYSLTVVVTNAIGSAERQISLKVGDTLALTPPMGWNSYDSFDDDVREAEFLAQASWVRDNLLSYGWDTVVVDYRWYDPNTPGSNQGGNNPGLTIDDNGRLFPATNKFPSAANGVGFKNIADQVHAMGLKFGIHIMRGIPRLAVSGDRPIADSTFTAQDAVRDSGDNGYTCVWNTDMYGVRGDTPAGQAWYDSIFSLFSEWGIDFVKVDDMTKNRPADQIEYHQIEVEAIVNAIKKTGRSIVFSLSPGETPLGSADHVKVWGNMWRMSDDFWDRSGDLDHIFDLANSWQVVMDTPGHWPDADMLPLGHLGPRCPVEGSDRDTRFTKNEQVTMMTLWALLPSPMMLGTNLVETSDAWTRALLSNEEVLGVGQDGLGSRARRIDLGSDREAWIKDLSDGRYAVGLFNRGAADQTVTANFAELGISGRFLARLLWQRQDLGLLDSTVEQLVPTRAALLVELAPETPPDASGGAGGVSGAAGSNGGQAGAATGGAPGGGASGSLGTSGGVGGAGLAGTAGQSSPKDAGCGCSVPSAREHGVRWWTLGALFAFAFARRRSKFVDKNGPQPEP
jgi:alpha-galactosidase